MVEKSLARPEQITDGAKLAAADRRDVSPRSPAADRSLAKRTTRSFHSDVSWQLREQPDPFTFPECSGRVILEPAFGDDGIEKS